MSAEWTPVVDVVSSHERICEVMDAMQSLIDLHLKDTPDLASDDADRKRVRVSFGHLLVVMLLAIDGYNAGVARARARGDVPVDPPHNTLWH